MNSWKSQMDYGRSSDYGEVRSLYFFTIRKLNARIFESRLQEQRIIEE